MIGFQGMPWGWPPASSACSLAVVIDEEARQLTRGIVGVDRRACMCIDHPGRDLQPCMAEPRAVLDREKQTERVGPATGSSIMIDLCVGQCATMDPVRLSVSCTTFNVV